MLMPTRLVHVRLVHARLVHARLVHAGLVHARLVMSATVHRGVVCVVCVAALLLAACGADPAPSADPSATPPAAQSSAPPSPADSRAFVGRVWAATHPSASRGTFRIFLPDGTLVMDSCGETYRLARWEPLGDGGVVWEEDTARIEAEVVESAADALTLRLQLVGEVREEHYVPARVPFVCPDSRPSP
ncbi:MAG: hypothetical protein AB7G23_19480 [Vicinamibacterales bacterium]